MGLDIRLPIGIMFSMLGSILAAFGALADKGIYQRSLGININLWWGLVMLLFGLAMLWAGRRTAPQPHSTEVDDRRREPDQPEST